jgi:S1-C subfamily serine protease
MSDTRGDSGAAGGTQGGASSSAYNSADSAVNQEAVSSQQIFALDSTLSRKPSNRLALVAIFLSIAALIFSLFVFSNSLEGTGASSSSSDTAFALDLFSPPKDLPGLIKQVEKSLVAIECNGYGSGFAMDLDVALEGMRSVIVTNHHVIEDCIKSEYELVVIVGEDQSVKPKVEIWSWDKVNDLALLEIDVFVPPLPEATDFAERGWWTMAIGSPVDTDFDPYVVLYNSTTYGQISYVWDYTYNYTSATINGGNSGGPLVNSRGEFIGINSFAEASTEGGVWNIAVDSDVRCEKLLDCE